MKEYKYKVCLCDGQWCDGYVTVNGDTELEACDNALNYVATKLADVLPELGIEVSIKKID